MKIGELKKIYNTVRHLKAQQLFFQVYYRLRAKAVSPQKLAGKAGQVEVVQLKLTKSPCDEIHQGKYHSGKFTFLNLSQQFDADHIDWNFPGHGRLWSYNLNYFEFLNDASLTAEEGLRLIRHYVSSYPHLKDGLEPYPISLRGISWIKFLSRHGLSDAGIHQSLFVQYQVLINSLEYHLGANHLLENAFSLVFGGVFFKDQRLYGKGKRLTMKELNNQLFDDGGHYERSPMYHQIIFHRLLDTIDLLNVNGEDKEFEQFLREHASRMNSWLEQMTFDNGSVPWVNDASPGVAPDSTTLLTYAKTLGIEQKKNPITSSAYRLVKVDDFELLLNLGSISPHYQPGHSHADTFNIIVHFRQRPIIVDTGTSTYNKNVRRQLERSTASHNTVVVEEANSSEVWGGFRVANRAEVKVLENTADRVSAEHFGYQKRFGVVHKRSCAFLEDSIVIKDSLETKAEKPPVADVFFHFHPTVMFRLEEDTLVGEGFKMIFEGVSDISLEDYLFASEFNKLIPAKRVSGRIKGFKSKVTIEKC